MSHDFEVADEITLDATPDQVWDAIATGPGIDSWFMGRTTIEPGPGGTNTLDMSDTMGFAQTSAITAWEPGRRLAFREDGPGGTFSAVEYLLEGRQGGGTVLRFVHDGVLDGDWDAEYHESMRVGDLMYLRQLAAYLEHFPGRHATRNLFLPGPPVAGERRVWTRFADALSLTGPITVGAPIRLNVPGLPATGGTVEFAIEPRCVGVRTAHGILTLIKGHRDVLVVGYHGFSDTEDEREIATAWRSWLAATPN
ncbi:hypothetical protein Afil01_32560 [Actinorhabdospora filicis]|uniref:Activator of Hsp90 ATPase homologue 1/2-like C-terminal domain-containing protein n=1 Tax=Actinorhabdospora filicis TaxID=1785913 RepID=A0A9W6SK09_9ACTN|nr:SRPBCC domain-containing protein [Actinorhabdospora filicis]GLZ78449.1 hypothetical protein Afil01_32560 [Actinorhabdospora filicis]